MPTVLREGGFEFRIYTHDHLPPHVHVIKAGESAVILIETIEVRDNTGMSGRNLRRAQEIVAENATFLASEWERIGPLP